MDRRWRRLRRRYALPALVAAAFGFLMIGALGAPGGPIGANADDGRIWLTPYETARR